jgi:hypothetical protein
MMAAALLALILASAAAPEDALAPPSEPAAEAPGAAVPPPASWVLDVPRLASPPVIDGRIDESEWTGATGAAGFVQLEPDGGAPSTEPTRLWLGYDGGHLYLAVRADDAEAGKVVAATLARDGELTHDDTIEVLLDTNGDRRTAFLFATNPLGVQVDALVRAEGEEVNLDWDGLWSTRASRDPGGYSVEIAIPFRTLRFPERSVQTWGFNVARVIPRKREVTFWKPMSLDYGFYARYKVSELGALTGLEGLEPGRTWLAKPYVLGAWHGDRPVGPEGGELDGGGDLKWNLTTDLTADLTWNTDFAETEADNQEVNLTRFPLFFPEKREFFLEGASLFYVGERPVPYQIEDETQLFFSRRIGLTDDGGRQIPVLGGAKLTGRLGGYELGVLNLTTEEEGFEELGGGSFSEPRTNYSAVRLKRELAGRASVGVLGLATEPSGPGYNRVAGLDWDASLREHLKTGGFLARSSTRGVEADDWAGYADLDWDSKRLRARLAYTEVGESFADELGFVPRLGMRKWRLHWDAVLWPEADNALNVRQAWFTHGLQYITDREDRLETRIHTLQLNTWLNNNAGVSFKAFDNLEVLAEGFEIAPGVVVPAGEHHFQNFFFGFNTDYTKPLGGAGHLTWGELWDGHLLKTLYAVTYRPLPGLAGALIFERTDAELEGGDFTVDLAVVELSYAVSPRLMTRGVYQWRSDQNRHVKALLRWTYKPGADFYLVYDEVSDLTEPGVPFDTRVGIPGRALLTKTVFAF